jgi:hypothetical protein
MIRGASLLKDFDASSGAEVDELRAEVIKQKILFEAELRRQREISDERFEAMQRQLRVVVDDNVQLRHTLHALGERLALLENRARSASPAVMAHHQQQQNADGSTSQRGTAPARPQQGNTSAVVSNNTATMRDSRGSHQQQRHQSPVPRSAASAPQPVPHIFSQAHFVKIRSSPSGGTTPRTTPRAPITRTASSASAGGAIGAVAVAAAQPTSPAHIPFRPVLRSQPFRSPMRQQQLQALGKPVVNTGHWR